ncbi:MAG: hypothetical protein JXJ19_02160 [Elusimicrobia bacterium]|nr:hypothetical protein [Elusimicrobiota bacterium]
MELWKLIEPLGIMTYSALLLTVISGIRRWKLKKHVMLALLTAVIATVHALIVMLH